jgi:hypothetical protein
MQFNPKAGHIFDDDAYSSRSRRHHGRLLQQNLDCSLGQVIDVSAGGMRVISSQVASGDVRVEIPAREPRIRIPARIIWTKDMGRGQWEVGLQFVGMTPEISKQLSALALSYGLRMAG